MALSNNEELHGEAFNFGPKSSKNHTVIDLIEDLSNSSGLFKDSDGYKITDNKPFHEAGLLKLNCDKAMFHLNWEATLNYKQTVSYTGSWYSDFYKTDKNMFDVTVQQIKDYENQANTQDLKWTE